MPRLGKRERRLRSEEGTEVAQFDIAITILRRWGAGRPALRASLGIPSSRVLGRWRRGETAIAPATRERVVVVLAIYGRLVEADDGLHLPPLPALKRAGRPPLSGKALLEGGRLSDLLALLRQLVLAEEAAERRRGQRQQKRARRRGS